MKLLLAAGARPNFMKIAPIIRAIKSFNQIGQINQINETDQKNQTNQTEQIDEKVVLEPTSPSSDLAFQPKANFQFGMD
jgi:UDP-N-acetylglucosamine 2-epimerase